MSVEQGGLSEALEGLVSQYGTMVGSVAHRRGLPREEVDEVVQEVRIRLWRALGSRERITGVNTSYVYQTAMSAVCDIVRRRRSDRTESMEEEGASASMLRSPGPDVSYEQNELGQQIGLALEELATAQRPVVRMYLAGYPQAEIQALLGWSEAKTRNLLYRGLTQLRMTLSRRGIGPGAAL